MATWGFYQNQYMEQRLGKDWATQGKIYADNFEEQTAALSFIYASVRWGWDKLFG